MLPKTVKNTSKMEPKRVPKRSRTPSRKYAAPTWPKSPKRAPKMTSKWSLKSEKTVLGALFFSSKKDQFSEAVFSLFLLSPGGPGPWKSSQNAVRVCKNEGPTFSPKTSILSRIEPKMTSLRTLKTSQNLKKTKKNPSKNNLKKHTEKTIENKPVLAREREARLKMEGCKEMVSKLCWLLQWSSAAPAARPRPRWQMKKQLKKHGTSLQNEPKNRPGAVPEPTDSPDEPKAPRKVAERAHIQLRQAKGTQQDDTSTPNRRQRFQKSAKRTPNVRKKARKMIKTCRKDRQLQT